MLGVVRLQRPRRLRHVANRLQAILVYARQAREGASV
jgi:hypothetical protein